jgi:large subunit ribosomal protein L10
MNRTEKQAEIDVLHEKMAKAAFVATIAYEKLDANTTIELRKAMRTGGIDYKVVKNTLALRAAKGTETEKLASSFTGPVAIALGYSDPVSAAKVVTEALKKSPEKVKLKTAVAAGSTLDAKGVEALSKLPGLPETRAQILAMILTPATTLVRLINTPGGQLARVLQANVDKQGGGEQAA